MNERVELILQCAGISILYEYIVYSIPSSALAVEDAAIIWVTDATYYKLAASFKIFTISHWALFYWLH